MPKKILNIGHRGAAGLAPENTLKSVHKALDHGVDWIEVDVYYVDGELLVIHDDRLERTTNGSGYVLEKSFSYLRSLDAGDGEQIPTLQEVLALIDRKAGINIELKGPDTAEAVATLIHDALRRGWQYDQFLVSSFNHHSLQHIKEIDPNVPIGVLIYALPLDYAAAAGELTAFSVNMGMSFITKAFVEDAHKRQLKVFVYTVNEAEDFVRMAALGVDGIFTDYPDRLQKFLRNSE